VGGERWEILAAECLSDSPHKGGESILRHTAEAGFYEVLAFVASLLQLFALSQGNLKTV
jgi:hypothetical protein